MKNFKLSVTSLDEFESAKNNLIDFAKNNCKKVKISNDILDVSKTINKNEIVETGEFVTIKFKFNNDKYIIKLSWTYPNSLDEMLHNPYLIKNGKEIFFNSNNVTLFDIIK
jgi:hypothetical protein